jgi:type IX secretion system PorP/SprF family membrane protein
LIRVKLQFGNQFNPIIGYDPTLPSNEVFANRSATSMDGSLGLFYFDGDPLKSVNPFVGVSLYHPTQPNNRFLSGDDNKIPMRYAIHGGVRFKMGSRAELIPHAVFMQQGNANEIAAGMMCNLKIQDGADLLLGGLYRADDAIAPNIGLHFNGLTIGLSYDINTSQLKTASSSKGGYELSISFTNQKKIPDTKFICPRL